MFSLALGLWACPCSLAVVDWPRDGEAGIVASLLVPAHAALADGTESNNPGTTVAPLALPKTGSEPAPVPTIAESKVGPAPAAANDYSAGKAALDKKDWSGAIAAFTKAAALDPTNADVQNFLGFASRMNGDYPKALAFYAVALKLNPNHRGAHEYLGETYLKLKNPTKAKAELATLKKICGGTACGEYQDLAKAIAASGKKK